jgi:hypothetical protein
VSEVAVTAVTWPKSDIGSGWDPKALLRPRLLAACSWRSARTTDSQLCWDQLAGPPAGSRVAGVFAQGALHSNFSDRESGLLGLVRDRGAGGPVAPAARVIRRPENVALQEQPALGCKGL